MNHAIKADHVAEQAHGAHIAAICGSDATYPFSIASQIISLQNNYFEILNKMIVASLACSDIWINFVSLDLDTFILAVFFDAFFAANPDSSSQLGCIITLMDKNSKSSIIHYGSLMSKRVTRSVLALELFAMVHGFEVSSTIRLIFNAMLNRVIPFNVYFDSRSLYECLVRVNQTAEKRLLIDLGLLRQAYERR